jgi:hypothetical protein
MHKIEVYCTNLAGGGIGDMMSHFSALTSGAGPPELPYIVIYSILTTLLFHHVL